jgi:mannose-1-phosphate guanylyltransferase
MRTIRSLLLAAGRGERLRPVTDVVPKPALPLLDAPVGAWGLADLASAAPPVVVNVSHLASLVVDALAPYAPTGEVESLHEPSPLGTAGTLRALRNRIGDRIVTRNADLLAGKHAAELLEAHLRAGVEATALVAPVERGADFEVSRGRVTRFIDRRLEPAAGGARFMGMAVFEGASSMLIPDHGPQGLGETVLRVLADRGQLAAHESGGYMRDIGTPASYLAASLDCLTGLALPPPGGWPGDIIEVRGGRAYVGPGAHVRAADLRHGAVVLRGARVAPGSKVANSIVLPKESVGRGEMLDSAIWVRGEGIQVPREATCRPKR